MMIVLKLNTTANGYTRHSECIHPHASPYTPHPPPPHLVLHEQLFDDFMCEVRAVDPHIDRSAVGGRERGGLGEGPGEGQSRHIVL